MSLVLQNTLCLLTFTCRKARERSIFPSYWWANLDTKDSCTRNFIPLPQDCRHSVVTADVLNHTCSTTPIATSLVVGNKQDSMQRKRAMTWVNRLWLLCRSMLLETTQPRILLLNSQSNSTLPLGPAFPGYLIPQPHTSKHFPQHYLFPLHLEDLGKFPQAFKTDENART